MLSVDQDEDLFYHDDNVGIVGMYGYINIKQKTSKYQWFFGVGQL